MIKAIETKTREHHSTTRNNITSNDTATMALVQDDAAPVATTPVRVAVDRLLLPDIKVRASAASNSRQLEQRFNYLWHAAHNILATNALLAHQMMYVSRSCLYCT